LDNQNRKYEKDSNSFLGGKTKPRKSGRNGKNPILDILTRKEA
jgi:hypothetical protein